MPHSNLPKCRKMINENISSSKYVGIMNTLWLRCHLHNHVTFGSFVWSNSCLKVEITIIIRQKFLSVQLAIELAMCMFSVSLYWVKGDVSIIFTPFKFFDVSWVCRYSFIRFEFFYWVLLDQDLKQVILCTCMLYTKQLFYLCGIFNCWVVSS